MAGVSAGAYLELLESGQYSDLIIDCQGYEFKVHRAIVCAASPMLNKACARSFMEASEGRINLSEDDPAILARVILYLYTNDYEATTSPMYFERMTENKNSRTAPSSAGVQPKDTEVLTDVLRIHALVYKSADMLGLESLKVLASSRFLNTTETALLFVPDAFAEPLKIMFDSTMENDMHLRIPVLALCIQDYGTIAAHKQIVDVILTYEPTVWNLKKSLLEDPKAKEASMSEAPKPYHNCSGCNARFNRDDIFKFTVNDALDVKAWCSTFCLSESKSTALKYVKHR